jgi:hypothetical protein
MKFIVKAFAYDDKFFNQCYEMNKTMKKKCSKKKDTESSSQDSEIIRAQRKWFRRNDQQKSRDHTNIIEDCEQD